MARNWEFTRNLPGRLGIHQDLTRNSGNPTRKTGTTGISPGIHGAGKVLRIWHIHDITPWSAQHRSIGAVGNPGLANHFVSVTVDYAFQLERRSAFGHGLCQIISPAGRNTIFCRLFACLLTVPHRYHEAIGEFIRSHPDLPKLGLSSQSAEHNWVTPSPTCRYRTSMWSTAEFSLNGSTMGIPTDLHTSTSWQGRPGGAGCRW